MAITSGSGGSGTSSAPVQVTGRPNSLTALLDAHHKKLNEHTIQQQALKAKLESIETKLTSIENRLTVLEGNERDLTDFTRAVNDWLRTI